MFKTLFTYSRVLRRHREGPLAEERAAYLAVLAAHSVAPATLLKQARCCLRVAVELERWPADHCFDIDEVGEMASRYSVLCRASSSRYAKEHFRSTAADFLRHLGRLRLDRRALPDPYETMLCEFIALQHEQSWLSDATCRSARWHIARFLDDLGRRGLVLQTLQSADIDAFYQHMAVRWSRSSLNRSVRFVRAWLGYCETQGHVRPGLAQAMLVPRLYRHEALPMGPTWESVGRMLAATGGDDPASIRDHAILLLLSVYGVRSGEVRHLRLDDIDWSRNRMRFVRSKSGRHEEAPLVARVGNAIARYLREARPQSASRVVFLRLRAPPVNIVGRMLAATGGDDPASIRDHAILLLLSVYGVRSGEVRHLRLDDIDWSRNRMRFVRSKSGRHEEAPLVARVGNAIARYLREARPQSASRVVFLRLRAPYTPLSLSGLYSTVTRHFPVHERPRKGRGPHGLRHACARHLLESGLSFKEVGDHLGHRDPDSTRIYARVNLTMLRQVAFDALGGLT